MSHYTTVKTKFYDADILVQALEELCPHWEGKIENHTTAQNLYGYQGDKRSQVAHVIVRRKHVGASSNDLGFVRNSDGSYEAIISEYDRSKYGHNWIQKLSQTYAEKKTNKELKKQGWKLKSRTVDKQGRVQLNVQRWRS